MSEPTGKCEVCGEPMPAGEEMFKYHGYSGDCPKPPLPRPVKPTYEQLEQQLAQRDATILAQQATHKAMQECIRQLSDVFARRFPVCRDCADEAGICPHSTLPCEW